MRVSLIVAAAENGVIGRDGGLPWRLPDDLKRFRALTTGHHVVMGRRTHESIGRALPGRTNLVLSHDPAYRTAGGRPVASLDEAIAIARDAGDDELFVIGGAGVYEAALPRADRVYLTRVAARVAGDVHLSGLDPEEWTERSREEHARDDRHEHAFAFVVLDRRPRGAAPPLR